MAGGPKLCSVCAERVKRVGWRVLPVNENAVAAMSDLIEAEAHKASIPLGQLIGRSHKQRIVRVRHMLIRKFYEDVGAPIKDIATALGVDRSTVSWVINGKKRKRKVHRPAHAASPAGSVAAG